MSDLSIGEQNVYDEALRRRSEKFEKPVWMDSIKATKIKLMLRKAISELPPEPRTSGARVHYNADRRIVVFGQGASYGSRSYGQIHEADVDGLPICIMRNWFEEHMTTSPDSFEELGGGGVTCGHCANARTG